MMQNGQKGPILCVIPAFNEAETIATVLKALPREVLGYRVQAVVVDDGSRDNTANIARLYTRHVIRIGNNRGVGVATKEGLRYVADLWRQREEEVSYVFKCDGDGQHQADEKTLGSMISLLEDGATLVCGSRFSPQSEQRGTPGDRVILNCLFAGIISRITSWGVTDARTGFMGMSVEMAAQIVDDLVVERYGIPMNIILAVWYALRRQGAIGIHKEVPVPAIYSGEIATSRLSMYEREDIQRKTRRCTDAYEALLRTITHLGLSMDDVAELCCGCMVDHGEGKERSRSPQLRAV